MVKAYVRSDKNGEEDEFNFSKQRKEITMVVGDIKKWKKIILDDRTILHSDITLFSKEQLNCLFQLDVKEIKDHGKTLICK